MSSYFESLQRPKAYAQIVDQILERIRLGPYTVGDRLPAERELAVTFGVSRGTLKEAIRVLEHAGVLEVRVGSGTYVSAGAATDDGRMRAHAAALGDYSPLDVLETRLAIEPLSVAAAVRAGTPRDIEAISERLARHVEAISEGRDPTVYDLGFHLAIAKASRNELFLVLTEQLIDWMSQSTWRQYKAGARQRAGESLFVREHEAIWTAIVARDTEAAAEAMRVHLRSIREGILAVADDSHADGRRSQPAQ